MSEKRPDTPADVKLQLRQESGFGCAICGVPFVQYHHIIPWAQDNHFRPEDMMVLCPNDHHACTVGAIPEQAQRKAKLRPKNVIDGLARGPLYVTADNLTVDFAGGTITNVPNLLRVGGVNMLSCTRSQEGVVQVSAIVQNSLGKVVARIVNNEWSVPLADVWDFEAHERHATIRHGPGDIGLAVDCRKDRVQISGKWFINSMPVSVSPKKLVFSGMTMAGNNLDNSGMNMPNAVVFDL